MADWTTWLSALEVLALKPLAPEYSAVIECVPTVRLDVPHWALPEARATAAHSVLEPSLKVTVPVGVPELAVTIAAKVTALANVDGLGSACSEVEVATGAAAVVALVVAAVVEKVGGSALLRE